MRLRLTLLQELVAHGLRAARDDEAAVEEILSLELAQVDVGRADCDCSACTMPL